MMISYLQDIREKHLEFAEQRGSNKTYCPSEVARVLFPKDWRTRMDDVRAVADILWENGYLFVSQFGKDLDIKPSAVKGHIRLRLGQKNPKNNKPKFY